MRLRIHLILSAMMLAAMVWGSLLAGTVRADMALVGYWALDEGSGMTAADSATPFASDGVLAASPNTPTWTTGYLNGGLLFDGGTSTTGDRVNMPDTDELDLTGDLTLDFWMKPTGTGSSRYGHLVGKNMSGGSTNDGYSLDIVYTTGVLNETGITKGKLEFVITNGDVLTVLRSNTALSTGTSNDNWYHVRAEYVAGTRMSIYLDGVLDSEMTTGVPAACDSTDAPFTLGNLSNPEGSPNFAYSYKGVLDEVRVYSGVIPEPTSLAILVGGLLGLMFRRRGSI